MKLYQVRELLKEIRQLWFSTEEGEERREVPKHTGWEAGEVTSTFVGIEEARVRLYNCANVVCASRPMNGSIFCWACMVDENITCVKFPVRKLSPMPSYGGQYVEALDHLLEVTTLAFTRMEVQYSIMFDTFLVGSGRHQYGER